MSLKSFLSKLFGKEKAKCCTFEAKVVEKVKEVEEVVKTEETKVADDVKEIKAEATKVEEKVKKVTTKKPKK